MRGCQGGGALISAEFATTQRERPECNPQRTYSTRGSTPNIWKGAIIAVPRGTRSKKVPRASEVRQRHLEVGGTAYRLKGDPVVELSEQFIDEMMGIVSAITISVGLANFPRFS